MAAKTVDLRSVEVKLRSFQLTRSLIKQAKRLQNLPKDFYDTTVSPTDVTDKCIGYVVGSAIGEDEWTKYLLFVHNDDLYIYGYPGYNGKAKQMYI